MNFVASILPMPALVGVIFVLVGCIMHLFPPKKINPLYGYRTRRSMKNQEQWDFAQTYASKLLIFCGVTLTFISLLGFVLEVSHDIAAILSTLLIIGSIIPVLVKTEKAIKTKFDG
ncbi:SdpI family protein [Bizionia saleffrena]|uniref:SdpI family protein n=2 Tax=Bizionia saleffrena TaxID=291189 RepID=A0A8H2LEA3_9FLAO|nr:SdpI family protein [Bizionia saleffrena]TYB74408.1 SdpI family protein [Bizionia saleffrena]